MNPPKTAVFEGMTRRNELISVLHKKYPLFTKQELTGRVDGLLQRLKTHGRFVLHPEEPTLAATEDVVRTFFWGLKFDHIGIRNYEALMNPDLVLREKTAKHDPSRNGYQKKYQKKRYHERMEQAKKSLGGKCSSCGATSSLELDHKDPDNKSFNISKLWSVPDAEFKKEVKKCRLLCNACHRKNTGKQRENGEVKSVPGKSEYGKDNRKKASLLKVAVDLLFKDASKAGASIVKQVKGVFPEVEVALASSFKKTKELNRPVLTWNVFQETQGPQVLFRLYSREKDAKLAKSVLDYVKEALKPSGLSFDYEDNLNEPGLKVQVVSSILPSK